MHKIQIVIGMGLFGLSSMAFAAEKDGRGQQALTALDSNNDGVVDFNEFHENSSDRLGNADSDGDGVLSLEEFLAMSPGRRRGGPRDDQTEAPDEEEMAARIAQRNERASARFEEMDLDGNGLVSKMEFDESNFLQMDRDSDGVLSASELRRKGPQGRGRGGNGGRPDRQSGAQSADS